MVNEHFIILQSNRGGRKLDQSCLLTIVVPVYNEEIVLETLRERLVKVMDDLPTRCEAVLVNDGSTDRSLEILRAFVDADARFRAVDLARNFGHQYAVSAGLYIARGDVVAILDADLQDPPELIKPMLERWADGIDVIYGQRRSRKGETRFKLWAAHLYYWILSKMADVEIPRNAGDFRVIDRNVVDTINAMPENQRFLRGMFAWVGFRQEAFPYERDARLAGETKYPLMKMIRLSLDGIISFSMKPLRLLFYFGMIVTLLAFSSGAYLLLLRLFSPESFPPAVAGLFVTMLFMFGLNFIFLGIVGEYIGRSYINLQRRPVVIVRDVLERTGDEKTKSAGKRMGEL
ncbi:MAG: glycosyltransferase family 2 protein [Armatimonadetes bacterium]|nr:glycosyltransferase family 2 protein [Armatimonadota bacterium]